MIKNQEALEERANNLGSLNGINLVLVTLLPDPDPIEAVLDVYFHNSNELQNILNDFNSATKKAYELFSITGGHRILAGLLEGQVKVESVAAVPGESEVLRLTVKPIGDYSTYTLSVNYQNIDPLFGELGFKFRPGCFNLCAPDWKAPPAPKQDPPINYLAKDYDSFRHTLIAWMGSRVPGWQPTSEADLDQVLLELFSVAADELSDYQDRVMNEAYLGTARKRLSLARHARLMDYHIHQGNQASTWLTLEVKSADALEKGFPVWAGTELKDPNSVVFVHMDAASALFDLGPGFQTDLDLGTFSIALRDEFLKENISLSANVSVSIEVMGSKWLVIDNNLHIVFCVKKQTGRLMVYSPKAHDLLNKVGLYTWSDSIPALKAGSTQADLKVTSAGDEASAKIVANLIRDENVTHLLLQEHLNPLTGDSRGRDPTKRQLLKLLPGMKNIGKRAQALLDPLTGKWFVRVRWVDEDKLKSNYCFTVDCPSGKFEDVSMFHGNLVKVRHGRLQSVVYKEPSTLLTSTDEIHYERTERQEVICKLLGGPLAYKDTLPGGNVAPCSTLELEVEIDGSLDSWDEVISLIHSDDSDERGDHFVVEIDEESRSTIRFGDGTNGKQLPSGAIVHCSYQVGEGLDGNVGADTLRSYDKKMFTNVLSCWNPFDVTNGRAPEVVAEIIRRVPEAYRYYQLRAVTLKDYVTRAEELTEVSKAAARYMWTGSWRTVRVTIDPVGATTLSEEVEEKVVRHLEAVRLIGEDLEIRPPRYVPLDIVVSLCVHPDYWPQDVRSILEQEFSDGYTPDGREGFFHPDRWTFGQALRESQIVGRVQSVEGVDYVIEVTMKRWNEDTPGTEGIIEVQANEIVLVKNDPDHKEQGLITFDIKGGRR